MNATIQKIIEEYHNINLKEYNKIPNILSPPPNCLQSYELGRNGTLKVLTEAFSPFKLSQIKKVFENKEVFYSLFPEITQIFFEGNKVECKSSWIIWNVLQEYKFIENVICFPNEIFHIESNYWPKYVEYYLFCCEKHLSGTRVVIEIKFNTTKIHKNEFIWFLNNERSFIYNLNEILKNDQESLLLLNLEREFYTRLNQISLYQITLYSSESILMKTNSQFDEIIITGKSHYTISIKILLESLYSHCLQSPLFPKCKIIKQTERIIQKHGETPFFSTTPYSTDIVYCSALGEGSMFTAAQSMKCSCPLPHTPNFEVIICAELFNIQQDGTIDSIYYYHFKTPQKNNFVPYIHSRTSLNLFCAFLMTRFGVENNIPSISISDVSDISLISKQMLAQAIHIKENSLKKQRKILFPLNEKEIITNNIFTELSNELLHQIFSYLPLEDLSSCLLTCRKLRSFILSDDLIWQNFYNLYFSISSFNQKEFHTPKPRYIETKSIAHQVLHLQNIRIRWKTKRPVIRKRIEAFVKCPVNFIFSRTKGQSFFVATSYGKIKSFEYNSFNLMKDLIINDHFITVELNYDTKCSLMVSGNGKIYQYFYETNKLNIIPFQKHHGCRFTDSCKNILCWEETGNIDFIDFQSQKPWYSNNFNQCHISCIDKVDNYFYISCYSDSRIIGFDSRMKEKAFETNSYNNINTFDYFDTSLVCGCNNGVISLYDYRMNRITQNRAMQFTSINTIKVWNRKIVFGGNDRQIGLLDCTKNWFGNYQVLYTHQTPIVSIDFDDSVLISGAAGGFIIYSSFV
ncbi:F-box domain containing protein [Entamoeba histolytica HM-1:IMSS-B]|uniref:F-box domain containing protein n=6 Tax=Entamoeba histolytica TaxID=5759 RepID=C4MAE3_ENTH1|nr:F-box domain containing protein [Entamoeba histolytica HM-1:IMSS]EMD43413.1 F-box domain containing protein [Entamoeba histolytica KU27]EMH76717.1 F-box domain containing protein [Entamoeba histolytica HM-1:IMSS-B]EMS15336.1 F-box domain containing protein [Entamoeba histolytica HM-3:IMSS]ENY62625.1 F-box domain containing protein [Entamoeba histolytica HM-1:IMSS-A]GAT98761.1 f-box domain containing protein [Entamoeba histolytica]|eukprot:XP_649939.1 F-box domain containing protein [Entamoeba histolytica HM-1:IMSS]